MLFKYKQCSLTMNHWQNLVESKEFEVRQHTRLSPTPTNQQCNSEKYHLVLHLNERGCTLLSASGLRMRRWLWQMNKPDDANKSLQTQLPRSARINALLHFPEFSHISGFSHLAGRGANSTWHTLGNTKDQIYYSGQCSMWPRSQSWTCWTELLKAVLMHKHRCSKYILMDKRLVTQTDLLIIRSLSFQQIFFGFLWLQFRPFRHEHGY